MGFLAAAAPYAGPLIQGGLSIAGSAIGGMLANPGNQETKLQRQRRKLVDELINSLRTGGGAFGDLFTNDEDAFNRSFVEPAKRRFQNEISPQIQQQFINSGLQRGTGLDDALTRAGVDLNSMLDENYYRFQHDARNRKQNILNGILGGSEASKSMSTGQAAQQGIAGYFAGDAFKQNLNDIGDIFNRQQQNRAGYNNDWASQGAGAAGTFN